MYSPSKFVKKKCKKKKNDYGLLDLIPSSLEKKIKRKNGKVN